MEITKQSGIYAIINTQNGKMYIGSAVNFGTRWRRHRYELVRGIHHSVVLQRAWDKYGESALRFEALLLCAREHLLFYEQRCLDGFNPAYNIAPTAGSSLGIVRSEEFRLKMLGNQRFAGIKHTPETKALISTANTGRVRTATVREAMSLARTGKPQSPELVAKRAAANKGKKRSPEFCEEISARFKGVPLSLKHRAKLSLGQTARAERELREGTRQHTPEAKARMSIAATLREAKKRQGAVNA